MKIYDLVNMMPAENVSRSDSIATEVIGFGKKGMDKICSQIVSVGKGNDSSYRLMVESVSLYLVSSGKEKNRLQWERVLINNLEESINEDLKNYFLEQLNVIGSDYHDTFSKEFLNDMASSGSEISGVIFENRDQAGDR